MSLLGERAWWMPRWLDRVLPDIDVEGARHLAALAPAADGPVAEPDRAPAAAGRPSADVTGG